MWVESGVTVRMHLHAGLAVSSDNGKHLKDIQSHHFGKKQYRSIFNGNIINSKRENIYKMWYVSGMGGLKNNETFPLYNIKYATSKDCVSWVRKGKICIDYKNRFEHAIARPIVFKETEYKMWLSYKGNHYKIGYAESLNGKDWERNDSVIKFKRTTLIMIILCRYPFVVNTKDNLYLFYNGNNMGRRNLSSYFKQKLMKLIDD